MRACAPPPHPPRKAADLFLCPLPCLLSKMTCIAETSGEDDMLYHTLLLPAASSAPPSPLPPAISTQPGGMIRHTHVLGVTSGLTSPCLEAGLNWERLPRRGKVGRPSVHPGCSGRCLFAEPLVTQPEFRSLT